MSTATIVARDRSLKLANSLNDRAAGFALVGKAALNFSRFEVEAMASVFVWDSEIPAGLFPLWTVGLDALAFSSCKGNEVGQFVQEGTENFAISSVFRELLKLGIEFDLIGLIESSSGGCSHSAVPIDGYPAGEAGKFKLLGVVRCQSGQEFVRP